MKLTKISLKLDIKEGQDFTLQKASLMHGIRNNGANEKLS